MRWLPRTAVMRGAAALAMLAVLASTATAQEPADFFKQNCASCHTVGGGRLTGPDLKNVAQRKDREWLVQFILNPPALINSGDPYAAKLQQDARGVVMPVVSGINRARAEQLLDLVAAESKLEKSQFAGVQIDLRPFTDADVSAGRELFRGTRGLRAGGSSCMSCHTVRSVTGLGGGRLAPDLTRAYERLQGRAGMAAWLSAPATPTMQALFRKRGLQPDEVRYLTAFFESEARRGGEATAVPLLNFFLLGLGGAAFGLVLLDTAWRRRFRAVRRPLVRAERESRTRPPATAATAATAAARRGEQ